jgi:hypothetical protein
MSKCLLSGNTLIISLDPYNVYWLFLIGPFDKYEPRTFVESELSYQVIEDQLC